MFSAICRVVCFNRFFCDLLAIFIILFICKQKTHDQFSIEYCASHWSLFISCTTIFVSICLLALSLWMCVYVGLFKRNLTGTCQNQWILSNSRAECIISAYMTQIVYFVQTHFQSTDIYIYMQAGEFIDYCLTT